MSKLILRTLIMITVLTTMAACQNPPPAEESCNFVQNSFQRRVSWARLPVRFYLDKGSFSSEDPAVSNQFYKAVEEAMEVWNAQFDQPVLELIGRTEDLPAPRLNDQGRVIADGYNGIYRVEKVIFENTNVKDEQARTSISFRGDFIYEADILIDASEQFYFEDQAMDPSAGLIQFKSLLIHEFGHALGLGHVDDASVGSVMYPKLQFGEMRPAPIVTKSVDGEDVTSLELPEIDKESMTCEYQ